MFGVVCGDVGYFQMKCVIDLVVDVFKKVGCVKFCGELFMVCSQVGVFCFCKYVGVVEWYGYVEVVEVIVVGCGDGFVYCGGVGLVGLIGVVELVFVYEVVGDWL